MLSRSYSGGGGGSWQQVESFGTLEAPEGRQGRKGSWGGPPNLFQAAVLPTSHPIRLSSLLISTEKVQGKHSLGSGFLAWKRKLWLATAYSSVAEVPMFATRWQAQFTEIHKANHTFFPPLTKGGNLWMPKIVSRSERRETLKNYLCIEQLIWV